MMKTGRRNKTDTERKMIQEDGLTVLKRQNSPVPYSAEA